MLMTEWWREALIPLLVFGGYQWAANCPTAARRAAQAAAAISATMLTSVVLSGVWRPSPEVVAYHHWGAHGLIILDWLLVFPAIGIAARLSFPRQPWQGARRILVLALVLGLTFLTALTGYLGPSHDEERLRVEETQNRFAVLHLSTLPSIVVALTFVWFWTFRTPKPTPFESETMTPVSGDNPDE
jgi:hypothetical protein